MKTQRKPLLPPDQCELAVTAAREVFRELKESSGVNQGWGMCLLATALEEMGDDTGRVRDEALESALEVAVQSGRPWLYGGIAGTAWLASFLGNVRPDSVDIDLTEADEFLLELLRSETWPHNYDLIGGIVGIAVYFLERFQRAPAVSVHGLGLAVDKLEMLAVPMDNGVAWWTPPEHLSPWQQVIAREGYYNLGVAHGIPGILWTLAHAQELNARREVAERLFCAGMEWFMHNGRHQSGLFGQWVVKSSDPAPQPQRSVGLAWCYGGLGISAVLARIGRALGDKTIIESSIGVAREMARLPNGPADASLCHGKAGVLHIFGVLHELTGLDEFAVAARAWALAVLSFRQPGHGIGGFLTWKPELEDPSTNGTWETDGTFLTGAPGTALALLTAAGCSTLWDIVLLCR